MLSTLRSAGIPLVQADLMPEGQSAAISSRIAYRQPEQREHEMAVMNLLDDESGRQAFRLVQTFNVHK